MCSDNCDGIRCGILSRTELVLAPCSGTYRTKSLNRPLFFIKLLNHGCYSIATEGELAQMESVTRHLNAWQGRLIWTKPLYPSLSWVLFNAMLADVC